jgi:phospholipid/cholesterol/gamma-HCH transport system permease protein
VEPGPGGITLRLNGRLDAQSVAELWPKAMDAVSGGGQVKRVRVEASGLKYCDGAGIGLLAGLTIRAKEHGLALEYAGLDSGTQSLLDRALPTADLPRGGPGDSSIVQLGRATAETLASMAMMVSFLGEISRDLVWAATHPHRVRWMDVLLVCEKAGANALPVVCLLGWLMGLIIAFQTAAPLGRFGVDSMIPTMLAIAMVRELGPLVTAIILAGRSGSAFAAEIGTMKVTEELNALTTLGLDPVRFLALPRLIATMLMTPLLSLFAIIFGLAGGYLVMLSLGYSLSFYVNQVLAAVDYVDLLGGLFKSVVFAFLVAGVGCVRGLQTQQGPGAVGDSTTRAVVAGIVLIVVADGVLGGVFYAIGV